MNILLIHQYFLEEGDFGGSRFNEMTKVWLDQGHTVTVIAGMIHANGTEKADEYKGKYIVRKKQGGIDVLRCHVSEGYNKNFMGRFFGYLSFMISCSIAGLFKTKGKFDLVLVTSPPLFIGLSGILVSKLRRIPLVFEVRDLWPESAIDSGVLQNKVLIKMALIAEKVIYKNAKLINVLTPAFKKKLIETKNIPEDKIIYIPNGCDFTLSEKILESSSKAQLRKELGWEGKKIFTYVGAHGLANHLIQVLDAMANVKRDDIVFNLIGDGMEKPRLKKIAEERGINNVHFYDPVAKEDIFKYIIASDYGASVLKKVDTFKTIYSNKTFDYMSCKTPVFLLIDGISRELIETADCGVYAEPDNIEEITATIERLADMSEDELSQMGRNGYEYAISKFDREQLALDYVDLISVVKKE